MAVKLATCLADAWLLNYLSRVEREVGGFKRRGDEQGVEFRHHMPCAYSVASHEGQS